MQSEFIKVFSVIKFTFQVKSTSGKEILIFYRSHSLFSRSSESLIVIISSMQAIENLNILML